MAPNLLATYGAAPFTPIVLLDENPVADVRLINLYQSITCVPEFRHLSFEEWRLLDYEMSRGPAPQGFPAASANNTSWVIQPSKDMAAEYVDSQSNDL